LNLYGKEKDESQSQSEPEKSESERQSFEIDVSDGRRALTPIEIDARHCKTDIAARITMTRHAEIDLVLAGFIHSSTDCNAKVGIISHLAHGAA
jgi:hypothetical protein